MKYTLKINGDYMDDNIGTELEFSDLDKLFGVIKTIENNTLHKNYYEIYQPTRTEEE